MVRTSPDHGTAYALAGKNTANPSSFSNALYMAIDLYKRRLQTAEINQDPLQIVVPENTHKHA
jgi:4-hydroxythreonine-4-phosphate dehydrogenase